jgi:sugar O-acyltransferase (sialic acid O-acetyltransferase NeuD family)
VYASEVYLFGYSGHSYVVIETLQGLGMKVAGYFDKQEAKKNPYNLPYMGYEGGVGPIDWKGFVFPAVGDNKVRKSMVHFFISSGLQQIILSDASAKVSSTAIIQPSTYIGKNTCINALVEIGAGVIINTGAIIEHESNIGDFVHIAPASVLCGNVRVGRNAFIGANAVIKQGINIGAGAIIGAGAVVVKDVPDGETWVGNPAKRYF